MAEIDAALGRGEISDRTAGALGMAIAGARGRAPVSIVSAGISDDDARGLGFTPYAGLEAAMEAPGPATAARPR